MIESGDIPCSSRRNLICMMAKIKQGEKAPRTTTDTQQNK